MSRIQLDNYEAFLLDFFEGRISAEDLAALKAFVLAHPELDIDLDDDQLPVLDASAFNFEAKDELKKTDEEHLAGILLDLIDGAEPAGSQSKPASLGFSDKELELYRATFLSPASESFPNKDSLIKGTEQAEQNYALVAYFENSLNAQDKLKVEKELSANPAMALELQLLQKSVLKPDPALVFPDKAALKRETKVFVLFSRQQLFRAAAAVLLLLGGAFMFRYFNTVEQTEPPKTYSNKTTPQKNSPSLIEQKNADQNLTAVKKDQSVPSQNTKPAARDKKISKQPLIVQVPQDQFADKKETAIEKQAVPPPLQDNSVTEQTLIAKIENTERSEKEQEIKTDFTSLEISEDVELASADEQEKKGFWQKAVQLASQANKLGIKSVDGVEESKRKYRLSFNSFSVERH